MTSGTRSKLFVAAICIAVAALSIALVATHTLRDPAGLLWNRWAFYEWLINYQGGFVRRGVVGEFVHAGFYGREAEAINVFVFLLGAAFIALSTLQILDARLPARSAALYLFAPAGVFWLALANQYYYRKEMLFYLAILVVAALYRRRGGAAAPRHDRLILLLVGAFSLLLPLVHEAYLFFCGLFFSLVVHALLRDRYGARIARRAALAFVAANVAVFALLSAYGGSAAQVPAVWDSLSPQARALAGAEVGGGIKALAWPLFYAMLLPARTLISGLASFYLFALALLYVVAAAIRAGQRGAGVRETLVDPSFAFTCGLVCLSFLPLFLIGEDWGRWVFGIFTVAVTIVVSGLSVPFPPAWSSRWTAARARLAPRLGGLGFAALLLLSLLTRVPECCLSGSGGEFLGELTARVKSLLAD